MTLNILRDGLLHLELMQFDTAIKYAVDLALLSLSGSRKEKMQL